MGQKPYFYRMLYTVLSAEKLKMNIRNLQFRIIEKSELELKKMMVSFTSKPTKVQIWKKSEEKQCTVCKLRNLKSCYVD